MRTFVICMPTVSWSRIFHWKSNFSVSLVLLTLNNFSIIVVFIQLHFLMSSSGLNVLLWWNVLCRRVCAHRMFNLAWFIIHDGSNIAILISSLGLSFWIVVLAIDTIACWWRMIEFEWCHSFRCDVGFPWDKKCSWNYVRLFILATSINLTQSLWRPAEIGVVSLAVRNYSTVSLNSFDLVSCEQETRSLAVPRYS